MLSNPIERWQQWDEVKELLTHTYNEFLDLMRAVEAHPKYGEPADKDLPSYLIVNRSLEELLDFIEFHSKELDCEADAYEEAVM